MIMARLIDADKLIEVIDDDIASLDKIMSREGYDVCLCTLKMMKQYIKALPTVEAVPLEDYQSMEQTVHKLTQAIAEAEPIKHGRWIDNREMIVLDGEQIDELIRCKDCKHFQEDECPWTGTININDFCSRGERKDEATK